MKLILASGSPRRQQMLRDLGLNFSTRVPDIDESRLRGEPALHYVQRLAEQKALRIATSCSETSKEHSRNWAILSADTIVVLGATVLGKPTSSVDAVKMLKKLSGKTHEVITAFCWMGSINGTCKSVVRSVRTKVTFSHRPTSFWEWYVSTGEPMDKAGAYAAQGIGVSFIEKVSGSYSNVVGLPFSQVIEVFAETFKVSLLEYIDKSK